VWRRRGDANFPTTDRDSRALGGGQRRAVGDRHQGGECFHLADNADRHDDPDRRERHDHARWLVGPAIGRGAIDRLPDEDERHRLRHERLVATGR
jgi:hypothetical protein